MKIAIASAAPPRLIESRRLGNFRNRNAGGNGGGGGGNGGGGRRRFSEFNFSYLILKRVYRVTSNDFSV